MLIERNVYLYETLKQLVIKMLESVEKSVIEGAQVPLSSQSVWQPMALDGQGNSFFQQSIAKPHYLSLIGAMFELIKPFPIYQQTLEAIRADSVWGSHLDKLVGSVIGDQAVNLDALLSYISVSLVEKTQKFDMTEELFVEQVERLESFFQSSTIKYFRVVPLWGVISTSELSISEHISLVPISNEGVSELLDIGLILNFYNSSYIGRVPRLAIVTKLSIDKVVTDGTRTDDNERYAEILNPVRRDETTIIDLLTLLLDVVMKPLGSVTKSNSCMYGTRQYEKNDIINSWGLVDKVIEEEDKEKFSKIWQLLNGSGENTRHNLLIAVRRFSLAMTRLSLEDKLIDLMICAEALFLQDGNSELTYKLSHRAALFLGENQNQQKVIFKFFKDVYAMRSKVVHGTKSYSQTPKDADLLSSTTVKLAEHLRKAILKMLDMALNSEANSKLVNWEEMMFQTHS